MKTLFKILKWTAIILSVLVIGFYTYVQVSWDRTLDVPYPEITVSSDSSVIAYGRYLAFGPAHCADCHAPRDVMTEALKTGEPTVGYYPLSGGFTYRFDLGTLHFPNLTPDKETGIGKYDDRELARVIRHWVRPDGRVMLPIMEFQDISDEDLSAIIAFLRSQEPVRNHVPQSQYNFMGKAVLALLARPAAPNGQPPKSSPPEAVTFERGEYLANRMGQCAQCHTTRNELDFSLNGPRLAGGMELVEPWAPDVIFAPPNLTPDSATGHIVHWNEDQFIKRFRSGSLIPGSPMPWDSYARMSDTDLKAIFQYLMHIDPVYNETGPIVREAGSVSPAVADRK